MIFRSHCYVSVPYIHSLSVVEILITHVGPIIRLIQFCLKSSLSPMWRLNLRLVGVRQPSFVATDHVYVAFLNPISSAWSSPVTMSKDGRASTVKRSKTSVFWMKSLRRSNDTLPAEITDVELTKAVQRKGDMTFDCRWYLPSNSVELVNQNLEDCHTREYCRRYSI